MRKLFLFIVCLITFNPIISLASDGLYDYSGLGKTMHYIRQGASGANDGSTWADAWTNLPATLQRDHIYFIADGNYSIPDLDDLENESQYIYIVKATQEDHGESTNWLSSYGDGQATLASAEVNIETDYWVVDGQTRGSDWTSSYGFRFYISSTEEGDQSKNLHLDTVNYVKLAYIEFRHGGYSYCDVEEGPSSGQDNLYLWQGSNISISHCWFHDVNRTNIFWYQTTDSTVEYCFFSERYNDDGCLGPPDLAVHGEAVSIYSTYNNTNNNNTIRYSVFRNIEGSAIIALQCLGTCPSTYGGWSFYGLVFYVDGDHVADGYTDGYWGTPTSSLFDTTNGEIADTAGVIINGVYIYNCTSVDLYGSSIGMHCNNAGYSAVYVYNCVWVNPSSSASVTANYSQANTLDGPTSLFVSYLYHDYHLSGALEGYSLGSPYNTDMDGNTRGGDGTFDRGAYEYVSGSSQGNGAVIMRQMNAIRIIYCDACASK